MKLTVVMPVYNERATLLEILERVRAVDIDKEIIIVDNCSTDGTREIVEAIDLPEVRTILQDRNRCKGNSVKKGIAAARGDTRSSRMPTWSMTHRTTDAAGGGRAP